MPKLTDTQLVILSAAAQRGGGAILPLPASLTINKGAAAAVLKSLVKRGLIAEKPAGRNDEPWREADGQRMTLAITEAGLEAIGVETDHAPAASAGTAETKPKKKRRNRTATPAAGADTTPQRSSPAVRPGTKQAVLIDLLRRDGGATIGEIVEAIGWQPHSVRGAISGAVKKKLGLTVASETVDGRGRVYCIAERG